MDEIKQNGDLEVVSKNEVAKQGSKRVDVRVPIRISTIDPEKDPETGKLYFFTAEEYSSNISRSGAFITTPEPLDAGRRVLVEIDIPSGSRIQTIGRVVWNRIAPICAQAPAKSRPGIGIQFIGGRPDLLNELDRYLTSNIRRQTRKPAEMGKSNQPTL
jgi:Tfp pilus assembly protein PilZ